MLLPQRHKIRLTESVSRKLQFLRNMGGTDIDEKLRGAVGSFVEAEFGRRRKVLTKTLEMMDSVS